MSWRTGLVGVSVLMAAVACSSGGGDGGPPAAAGPTSGTPAPSGSDGSAAGAPTPTPTPALPVGCESLVPFTELDQALGRPLFGESRQVKGVAQPSIGRTGRLTCFYGLPKGGKGTAAVEVGVSTYKDATSATERVTATVASLRAGGATSQSSATVAGQQASVLGSPATFTAVLAQGDRTIVVTVVRKLGARAATGVAEKVLANWTR